ncbi:MAG: exosortase/archaeosortase family protein [Chthoniobacteraceae bacterium]
MSAAIHRLAWSGAVLVAWLLAWWHLSAEWSADEQYRYGFGVPVLAAWMMWRRFPGPMTPTKPGPAWIGLLTIALLILTLGEALARHDPLWRFTGATLELGATLLSIAWLHRRGGGLLVRRQLFPLLFAALAVPWPMPLELWSIHHLAVAVTDVAVSTANIFGIAALQHGNTIELAGCTVGVDDACSGIQSLQATLMTSFFLGEFFMLRTPGRITLILAGAAISFVTNCARVLALTVLAHSRGESGAMEWHDFIGGTATICGLGLLLATAALLARGRTATLPAPSEIPKARMPEGTAIFLIVSAIFLGTHACFSRFEKAGALSGNAALWTISDDRLPSGWTSAFVPPTKALTTGLRFSEWQSFRMRDPSGVSANVIHLRWKAGTRMPAFATNHTPAVCMPSAGWTQTAPAFALTLKIHGGELPCTAYPFAREGTRVLALQSLSAGGRPESRLMNPAQIPGTFRRLAMLWQEPMRQITEELLLYIPDPGTGTGDMEARKKSAAEFLGAVLVPRS